MISSRCRCRAQDCHAKHTAWLGAEAYVPWVVELRSLKDVSTLSDKLTQLELLVRLSQQSAFLSPDSTLPLPQPPPEPAPRSPPRQVRLGPLPVTPPPSLEPPAALLQKCAAKLLPAPTAAAAAAAAAPGGLFARRAMRCVRALRGHAEAAPRLRAPASLLRCDELEPVRSSRDQISNHGRADIGAVPATRDASWPPVSAQRPNGFAPAAEGVLTGAVLPGDGREVLTASDHKAVQAVLRVIKPGAAPQPPPPQASGAATSAAAPKAPPDLDQLAEVVAEYGEQPDELRRLLAAEGSMTAAQIDEIVRQATPAFLQMGQGGARDTVRCRVTRGHAGLAVGRHTWSAALLARMGELPSPSRWPNEVSFSLVAEQASAPALTAAPPRIGLRLI